MGRSIIYCIDINAKIVRMLKDKGFNVKEGTLGKKVSTSIKEQAIYPRASLRGLGEADIVLIDNRKPEMEKGNYPEPEEHSMEEQLIIKPRGQNYFDPKPYFQSLIRKDIQNILKRGGILIVPAHLKYEEQYVTVRKKEGRLIRRSREEAEFSNFTFIDFVPLDISLNIRNKLFSAKNETLLGIWMDNYIENSKANSKFHFLGYFANNFIALAEDKDNKITSIAYHDVDEDNYGLVLIHPLFENPSQALSDLLTNYLPSILPKMFPELAITELYRKSVYRVPELEKLYHKREELEEKFKRTILDIESDIEKVIDSYSFLYGIVGSQADDERLVKNLEKFLDEIGYQAVHNMDEEIQDDENLQEDLQLRDFDMTLIEAKGIKRPTPSESECNQVLKYLHRRQKEYPNKEIKGVFVLNHSKFTEPTQRDTCPFTTQEIKDAEEGPYSLVTTWQLFRVFVAIKRGIITVGDFHSSLTKPGFVNFKPTKWARIGTIEKVYPKPNVLIFELERHGLSIGEEIFIEDVHFCKFKVENIQIDDENVTNAKIGSKIGVKISSEVTPAIEGNNLFKFG